MQDADAFFCTGHCHERGLYGCEVNLEMAASMRLGWQCLMLYGLQEAPTQQWLPECRHPRVQARYRLAAEKGHTVAQWRLGELCELLVTETSCEPLVHAVICNTRSTI